jgi:hypothetical protein
LGWQWRKKVKIQGGDNLCSTVFAGTCDTDLEYEAGWWGARILRGELLREQAPAAVQGLLLNSSIGVDFRLDNKCFEPDAECVTDADWQAGYWFARLEDGRISPAQLPTEFRSLVATPQCVTTFDADFPATFSVEQERCFFIDEVYFNYYFAGALLFDSSGSSMVFTEGDFTCPSGQFPTGLPDDPDNYVCINA